MDKQLKNRRVLVTGAAGFIGANLTRKLLRHGSEVHALIRPGSNLWRIKEIIPSLSLHTVDLINRKELEKIIKKIQPEFIFNLAVQRGNPPSQADWNLFNRNILIIENLLEASRTIDCERFVQIGSSMEYGINRKPLKESDCPSPATLYGVAKTAVTMLCRQFAVENRIPLVILRLFSVFGYWESPARLIPTAVRAALCNEEIKLTPPGSRHDFIFVEDVVEACLLALKTGPAFGETINIGSGEQWANEEVVEMIEALSGRKIRVRVGDFPPRSYDTAWWVADIKKAKRVLGWEPRHTLESGLRKTISWFQSHRMSEVIFQHGGR